MFETRPPPEVLETFKSMFGEKASTTREEASQAAFNWNNRAGRNTHVWQWNAHKKYHLLNTCSGVHSFAWQNNAPTNTHKAETSKCIESPNGWLLRWKISEAPPNFKGVVTVGGNPNRIKLWLYPTAGLAGYWLATFFSVVVLCCWCRDEALPDADLWSKDEVRVPWGWLTVPKSLVGFPPA